MIEIPESFLLSSIGTPFPQVELALEEPNGLIAVGGELSSERLIDAYSKGIFPWYSEDDPILWYSPDPRMVITPERLHISKSLQKTLNTNRFEIQLDTDFDQVIQQCKTIERKDQNGTWIDNKMVAAYSKLHEQGVARSVEVYQDKQLVGGLYGISMGKVLFGESMFSLVRDASKVAFVYLLENMNYQLVDCQVENPHLKRLGAFNIQRSAFIQQLQELL